MSITKIGFILTAMLITLNTTNAFSADDSASKQRKPLKSVDRVDLERYVKLANGKFEEVIGAAKLAPNDVNDKSNAKLKVRFAPAWLSWLPQVWGNYWVVDLDADYQYAVVSEPEHKFLWILSRTPTMEPAKYAAILDRLRMMGFDTTKLVVAPPTETKL
jgi:apolipoprotein D and lipocalin family protein